MIDWVKCKIKIIHSPIRSGAFVVINAEGDIERESPMAISIAGSYESSIQIRSQGSDGKGNAEYLEICGNPAKFLQGHNVFGSNDLVGLVHGATIRIFEILGLTPTEFESSLLKSGNFYVNWIDINESFELRNQTDVRAWIRAAEFSSRTRCGRPTNKAGTLYHQKHSRRFAIKFYSKFDELNAGKKHCLPHALEDSGIKEWAENILRAEVRLLGKELRKLELDKGFQFTEEKIKALYEEYMSKIILTEQFRLKDEIAFQLPPRLQQTYTLWLDGHSPIDLLSKSSYYRQRKELLEFGIDISIACNKAKTNVVPLIRVLEAKPAQVPTWAYDKGLIFQSEIRKTA